MKAVQVAHRAVIAVTIGVLGPCAAFALAQPEADLSAKGVDPDNPTLGYNCEEPEYHPCVVLHRDVTTRGFHLTNLWPGGQVPYAFDVAVTGVDRQRARDAMDVLESVCDVHFVERTSEADYLYIQNSFGNNSFVGRIGGAQTVNLYNWSLRYVIVHELMHALGFKHEHQRPDRDSFVTINFLNVIPGLENQFTIESGVTATPYDYLSVMHYSTYAFSVNGQPTIITADPAYQNLIGNRNQLSDGDIDTLQDMYGPPQYVANNDCANAFAIAGDGVFDFDNSAASADGEPNDLCGTGVNVANDIWFRWTAGGTGPVAIDTCGQTDVDTIIAVYEGSACPSGSRILACSDDSCGVGSFQTTARFSASAGAEYLIRLGTPPGARGGLGTFSISTTVGGPANDNCVGAEPISGYGDFAFDNSSATTDGFGSDKCDFFGQSSMDNDVWYDWTAPETTQVSVATCGGTLVDTKVSVQASADCGSQVIACSDDACSSLQSEVRFGAEAGQTYKIRVGTHPGSPGGTGLLSVGVSPDQPANDNCGDATPVAVGSLTPFDTTFATTDGPLSGDTCSPNKDVWFSFVPESDDQVYTIDVCSSDFDTVLAVYQGFLCSAQNIVACNDDACGRQSRVVFRGTAGVPHLIRVGGAESAFGTGALHIVTGETPLCPCELDGNTASVDVFDLLAYLDLWFAQNPGAEFTGDSPASIDVFDLLAYLDCWFPASAGNCG